jgi:DNA ligase-1
MEDIQEYLNESVRDRCEGLMVKTLEINSSYEPAKRSFKWLKVKKDYIENNGVGDSLDLVVVGANFGQGRRTGKFGVFLMAVYDPDYDNYETVCMVGTGFSDEFLKEQHEFL